MSEETNWVSPIDQWVRYMVSTDIHGRKAVKSNNGRTTVNTADRRHWICRRRPCADASGRARREQANRGSGVQQCIHRPAIDGNRNYQTIAQSCVQGSPAEFVGD